MFDDFEFEEKFNPWDVESLEEFRFYCCPECPSKTAQKTDFIKHAVIAHPHSQRFIERLEDNKTDIKTEINTESLPNELSESTNAREESDKGKSTVQLCYTSDDSSDSALIEHSDEDDFIPDLSGSNDSENVAHSSTLDEIGSTLQSQVNREPIISMMAI